MKKFLKLTLASCLGVILASGVVIFLFFFALGNMIGSLMDNSEVQGTSTKELKENSVLLLDLKGPVYDQKQSDIRGFSFSSEEQTFSLPQIIRAIEVAKENSNVDAIILKLENAAFGFATAQEIRNALLDFKKSGKKIYAYADMAYSYGGYYISSVADKLYANPKATVEVKGLRTTLLFFKSFLEKVGVEVQVFKVGTFKSVVEPFTQDKMSEANKLQTTTFLNGLWKNSIQEIAQSRNITPERIQEFADKGFFMSKPGKAIEYGLIDSLVYTPDIESVIAKQVTEGEEDEVNELRVKDLLKYRVEKGDDNQIVAVLYAEGDIVDRDPEDSPFAMKNKPQIDGRLVRKLRELAEDESVKAVVLRVNSPGGSARMSELIYNEIVRLKKVKPIVASMGNAATSGGYYISSNCSKILASPLTLTGSIGIFAMVPDFSKIREKLGLKTETIKVAKFADLLESPRSMSQEERNLIQGYVNEGYTTFVSRVSQGRKMSPEAVEKIAEGRVWLGEDALRIGLIDKFGGLDDAILEAARLADLKNYRVCDYTQKRGWIEELLSSFEIKGGVLSAISTLNRGELAPIIYLYDQLKQHSGVLAVPPIPLTGVVMDPSMSQQNALYPGVNYTPQTSL